MYKIFEYLNGRIKIMVDEKPMNCDIATANHTRQVKPKQFCSNLLPNSLGLEIAVHRGGRICYGLISSSVTTNDVGNSMTFSIDYTENNTVRFTDSIMFRDNYDYLYRGLPKEYLESVINAAVMAIMEKESFPLCNISFDCAANCKVGSSPIFFEMISEAVIELITVFEYDDLTFESYRKFIEEKFNLKYKN